MSVIKRNHVHIVGSGTKHMVLAHGFGTDQTSWRGQVGELAKRYRVVLFDHMGCGGSEIDGYSPHRYRSLRSYAFDMLEMLHDLDVSNAYFVGHSMSGMIGLLAAIEEPSAFCKLIFVGASPRYLNDVDYVGGFVPAELEALYQAMRTNYYAWASGFAPVAMQNAGNPSLAQQFMATLQALRPDIALSLAKVIFESDHRAELDKVDLPTLVLQTRADIAVPMAVGEYLAKHLKCGSLQILDAEGHFPQMSAPDAVTAAILDFAE